MNSCIRVSVVIPCFNHGEFLREAVGSVLDARRDDVELIVVDDGSTDERTRHEMDALPQQDVRVLRQENKGLAGARNAGIGVSHGEYVFPLDADDRMRTGWVDRALTILDTDRSVGVVYGDAECFGARTGRWRTCAFDRERLLYWNYIHCSALYRRSIWEQLGGYDGTMPVQGLEDWDFWLGALEHGWHFAYLPEVFFEYRQAQDSMITRTSGFESAVGEFVGRKHGALYRDGWLAAIKERDSLTTERDSLIAERESGWRTFSNLQRLVRLRARVKFQSIVRPSHRR